MTKTDIANGILDKIANFAAGPNDTLTGVQETDLTDQIAAYLDTVNPTNDYPPTKK